MSNLPSIPGGASLPSDPSQMAEYYRKMAEAYASTERRAGSSVSTRGGIMSVSGQPIPGNQFAAIILDAANLKTWYAGAYNPSVVTPPNCYAISRSAADLAPHPDMAKDMDWFKPQAERCGACRHNERGTAQGGGEGKACRDHRRILLLVAGTYGQTAAGLQMSPILDPAYYETAQAMTMTIPPLSLSGWGEWLRGLPANYGRPPFGVIARVYMVGHPKAPSAIPAFETIGVVPDAWMLTLAQRHEQATRDILEGYEAPMQTEKRR